MSSSCLANSTLAGLIEGTISDSERLYVSEHVDDWAGCADFLDAKTDGGVARPFLSLPDEDLQFE